MKYLSDERGVMPVLIAILVLVLVAAGGLAVYNVSKSHQKTAETASNSSPSPSASPEASASPAATATPTPTPAPTDQELIAGAVKAKVSSDGSNPVHGSQIVLTKLQGNYASVNEGQGFMLLSKAQGSWKVVFEGQNIDPSTESSLGFPQGFTSTGSFEHVALYTY